MTDEQARAMMVRRESDPALLNHMSSPRSLCFEKTTAGHSILWASLDRSLISKCALIIHKCHASLA